VKKKAFVCGRSDKTLLAKSYRGSLHPTEPLAFLLRPSANLLREPLESFYQRWQFSFTLTVCQYGSLWPLETEVFARIGITDSCRMPRFSS